MGFLTSLFGGGENGISWWGVGFALIIVLVLIVAGLWLLKLIFGASGAVVRGRQRRLAIIDNLSVDAKRNLVLIRRDDVEHLLVLGGTHDLVVETGISTGTAAAAQTTPTTSARSPREASPQAVSEPESNRAAAASRLGLTGLLRRYNDPDDTRETAVDTQSPSPLERLKNIGKPAEPARAPALRHTGLLRPASNDDADDHTTVEEPQIPVAAPSDSAMNDADSSDELATSSGKQEAAADHADSDSAGFDGANGDEFADDVRVQAVETDEFAPEVSIDNDDRELDEDATEPADTRSRH